MQNIISIDIEAQCAPGASSGKSLLESGFCPKTGPERLGARRGAAGAWDHMPINEALIIISLAECVTLELLASLGRASSTNASCCRMWGAMGWGDAELEV